MNVDAIVIGAGAMGTAAAWRLARRGRSVLVLERFDEANIVGASHGTTRNFSTAYSDDTYLGLLASARKYWRRRLTRLNYDALPATSLFRPGDVQIRRADDAPSFVGSASDNGYRPRAEGEIALTVRPSTTHAGNVRLFGPELTFVIVDDGERLVIARILEDFQLL